MNDNEITVPQLATKLNVSRTSISIWIERGVLPQPLWLGNLRYWPIDVLPELLKRIEERSMWGKPRRKVVV